MGRRQETVSVVIYRQEKSKQQTPSQLEFFLTHHASSVGPQSGGEQNGTYQLIGGEMKANEMPLDAMVRCLRSKLIGLEDDTAQQELRRSLGAWGTHQVSDHSAIHSFYLAVEDIPTATPDLKLKPDRQLEGAWFPTPELGLMAIAFLGQDIIHSLIARKKIID